MSIIQQLFWHFHSETYEHYNPHNLQMNKNCKTNWHYVEIFFLFFLYSYNSACAISTSCMMHWITNIEFNNNTQEKLILFSLTVELMAELSFVNPLVVQVFIVSPYTYCLNAYVRPQPFTFILLSLYMISQRASSGWVTGPNLRFRFDQIYMQMVGGCFVDRDFEIVLFVCRNHV